MRLFINRHPFITLTMIFLVCSTIINVTRIIVEGPLHEADDEECEKQKATE